MKKKRPSHYKPEDEATRTTTMVSVRVAPGVAEVFANLADEDGSTKAETFTVLVTKERARRDRQK